jgi:outer membrane protein assembly factor BamB
MRTRSTILLAATVAALPWVARGADWPQFRGPDRNGVSKETGLLKSWPKEGPTLLWTYENAGQGFAGPAVVGGKLYTMGCRKDTEYVIALDDKCKERWSAKIGPVYDFRANSWSKGPNGTPTVDGDRVYALGSQGVLVCVNAGDGKEVWRKDLPKDLGAEVNPVTSPSPVKNMGWGFAWSPLLDGDRLICTPGGPQGLFAALDKKTGRVLWQSKDVKDMCTYASPVVAEVGGVRQYVCPVQEGLVGVAAADGALLWRFKREEAYQDIVAPTPIVQGDKVYATAWGGGATLVKLTPEGKKFKPELVYGEREISNIVGGVILVGGHVYGFQDKRAWECQEFDSGKITWRSTRRGLGPGSAVYADGNFYCLDEDKGIVALIAADPKKYTEKARFELPKKSSLRKPNGKIWTYPVISDGKLYLRDQELIFCYQVK